MLKLEHFIENTIKDFDCKPVGKGWKKIMPLYKRVLSSTIYKSNRGIFYYK